MLKKKVKPQWMVLARHFGMPGGIFDYGEATIEEFLKKSKVFDELSEIHLINDKLEVEKWRKKLIGKNES